MAPQLLTAAGDGVTVPEAAPVVLTVTFRFSVGVVPNVAVTLLVAAGITIEQVAPVQALLKAVNVEAADAGVGVNVTVEP